MVRNEGAGRLQIITKLPITELSGTGFYNEPWIANLFTENVFPIFLMTLFHNLQLGLILVED